MNLIREPKAAFSDATNLVEANVYCSRASQFCFRDDFTVVVASRSRSIFFCHSMISSRNQAFRPPPKAGCSRKRPSLNHSPQRTSGDRDSFEHLLARNHSTRRDGLELTKMARRTRAIAGETGCRCQCGSDLCKQPRARQRKPYRRIIGSTRPRALHPA
jgi:hypothetical protein